MVNELLDVVNFFFLLKFTNSFFRKNVEKLLGWKRLGSRIKLELVSSLSCVVQF